MTPDIILGIKWYLVFLFSTTFHEASHAWTAYKLGDDTAHRGGQVTLDPTPHIMRAPFGMVVVPIISYLYNGWMLGWASAPYNPHWAVTYPKRSALMSLAGPAANLILVLGAAILIRAGIAAHFFDAPNSTNFSHVVDAHTSGAYLVASFLSICFSLNLLLCTFNLLPLPPLDGSGALLMFTDSHKAEQLMGFLRQPQFQLFGILIAWKVFDIIFPTIQLSAVNLLYFGLASYHLN